jgi:hypothetical protein
MAFFMAIFVAMSDGKKYLKRALLFAFGLKLFYLLLGNLMPHGWNGLEHVLDVFARNDSGWYHQIARDGYPTYPPAPGVQTSFAFFPLYPAIISLFRQPLLLFTQNNDLVYVLASFLVHLPLTWLWVVMLFKWLGGMGFDPRRALVYSIFFQVFPYHFFYHMFYSEVLFSILFMWALIAVQKKMHLSLAMAVALLTLCRPTGIVFSAGLGLWLLAENGWFRVLRHRENFIQLLALFAAPVALVLWMVYLYFHCGDPVAFSSTQAAWGHAYTWPWEPLFAGRQWYLQLISIYILLLILSSILLLRKTRLGEQLFFWLNALFPLITGSIASYYRYFSVIPTYFIRLFTVLETRWKWVVAFGLLLNVLLYYVWVSLSSRASEEWLTF